MNRIDREVRAAVYAEFIGRGTTPNAGSIAQSTGLARDDAASALRRLHDAHRLVLSTDGGSVAMAHPFSGFDTGYSATIGERVWSANCGWDAFAILAMLGDGEVCAVSPLDGTRSRWAVADGAVRGEGVIHFLVPARHFWDDIGFT